MLLHPAPSQSQGLQHNTQGGTPNEKNNQGRMHDER
jgi:hypothetical protein